MEKWGGPIKSVHRGDARLFRSEMRSGQNFGTSVTSRSRVRVRVSMLVSIFELRVGIRGFRELGEEMGRRERYLGFKVKDHKKASTSHFW